MEHRSDKSYNFFWAIQKSFSKTVFAVLKAIIEFSGVLTICFYFPCFFRFSLNRCWNFLVWKQGVAKWCKEVNFKEWTSKFLIFSSTERHSWFETSADDWQMTQTRKPVSCVSKTRKTNSCSFLRHNVSLFTNSFIRKTIRLCFDCTQSKIAIHCVARNYSCLFSLFLGKILNFKNVVRECFLNFYKQNHNAV